MYDHYGIKYQSKEVNGPHDWSTWRLWLSHFAPLQFR